MRKHSGLTLLELLVALGLIALMAALGWRGLDAMLRTHEHTKAASRWWQDWQTALAQWRVDLDAMLEPADDGAAAPVWSTDAGTVRLLRRAPRAPGLPGGWLVVAWAATDDGTRWSRWQSPVLADAASVARWWDAAPQRVRAEGVRTVAITDWQVLTWREGAWQPANTTQPPAAVRLVLSPAAGAGSGASGPLTLDWVSARVAGGKQ
jgi:general secretion pathway protein J